MQVGPGLVVATSGLSLIDTITALGGMPQSDFPLSSPPPMEAMFPAMAFTRPRRSLPATSYKEMLNSDSEDSESAGSDSDLSEDSNEGYSTPPDQRTSNSTQVVRLPTATDILETQEFIRTTTAELAIVNTEYKEAKRKFEVVQAKRDAMERELLERRAYLSRVRALPQEVLGLIFLFYTDDLVQSPWVLMQVTRTWRATALSTRAIWAKIMITSPAWKKSGAPRRKEGREVCGSKEQLDRALRRAGNAALDIVLAVSNPFGGSWARNYDQKATSEMLNLLSSSRKCLQVRHLAIKGSGATSMFRNSYRPLQFPPSLEFPELRTICIKPSIHSEFMAKFLRASKKITEAEFALPFNPPFGMEDLLQRPAMVTLTLDAPELFTSGVVQARGDLDSTRYLTTLHLSSFSSTSDTILQLPSLHTLVLSTRSKIWPLDAPNLTNLTLSGGSCIRVGTAGSNYFPLLTSLTINAPTRATPPDYLKNLHFHPLHTLDVCFGTQKQELAELMSHQADLNPVVFRLRKTVVSTVYLTEIIDSMARLEELQLEDVPLKKDFFNFLASCRANPDAPDSLLSGEIDLHCPLLGRLQVDLRTAQPAVKKTIKPASKKAIEARVKAGIAMEKWSIRFSEDQGWLDLLA